MLFGSISRWLVSQILVRYFGNAKLLGPLDLPSLVSTPSYEISFFCSTDCQTFWSMQLLRTSIISKVVSEE